LPAIIGKNCGDNFIKNTLSKLKKNLPIDIWNMNDNYNNLVHINDLNKLILHFISKKNKRNKIIIDCLCSKSIKLKNLIIYLKKNLKSNLRINYFAKKNNFKKVRFNSKISYKFLSVKKAIDLLI